MTRLKTPDICNVSSGLDAYNLDLLAKTGRSLLGIVCHASNVDKIKIKQRIESFCVYVVPVTMGQGIITEFCETVCAILQFLGFNAVLSGKTDVSGVALAYENKADAVMMADDHRFVGINLHNHCVVDNSQATGRVFAAALDLMAGGIKESKVLIIGCGRVGAAAASTLLSFDARLSLYDIHLPTARFLKERLLKNSCGIKRLAIIEDLNTALSNCHYIIEATPMSEIIPEELISNHMIIAAPGVPLGISTNGCRILKERLIHDKLELGVAAMAISLVS